MKTPALILATTLTLFLSTNLMAGVEPSPFQPEINKLEAVINGANSVYENVVKVLGCPPDDVKPSSCPDLNGAVNRLEAKDRQLNLLDSFVISVMEEVLESSPLSYQDDIIIQGTEPSPFQDLLPALYGVNEAALLIVSEIEAFWVTPPDDMLPAAFTDALLMVQQSALDMSENAQDYIRVIKVAPECYEDKDKTDQGWTACLENVNCIWWMYDETGAGFCCCAPPDSIL